MRQKLSQSDHLDKLGSENTEYAYDGADKSILERFPNPMAKGPGVSRIVITSPEFTSLCPKTGQPDFATIVLEYKPNEWCVESKAWKLYLGSFRNVGEFHESCVRRIVNDLIGLLDPEWLLVRGEFTPRGGIPFWPEIEYTRPEKFYRITDIQKDDEDRTFITQEKESVYLYRGEEIGLLDGNDYLVGWTSVLDTYHPIGCASTEMGLTKVYIDPEIIHYCYDDLGDASEIKVKETEK